jgi:DNA-binding NtrC family response regulator
MKNGFIIQIVEDDKAAGKTILYQLRDLGYQPYYFEGAEDALMFFQQNTVDLVLLDCKLPKMSGEELFSRVKALNPLVPVIFMTALHSVDHAVRLLKMGAFTYLTKPLQMEELLHNITNALEKSALVKENQRLQESIRKSFSFNNFIFTSTKMQPVIDIAMRAADANSNILISGESGTGKDVIANIIHHHSKRKNKKLIKVNLAALPETLIEAELFGAMKGAYTGALKNRIGRFEETQGGTLFLDEIGELSSTAQVKLLRVIQEREITRLGSNTPVKVDFRLITATNKDLLKLVSENKFREDLYYRLNVISIDLPPLRERKEAIPHLIDLFINKYNQLENRQVKDISNNALSALIKYPFPGNIRELENIIERSLVLAKSDILSIKDLPMFVSKWDGIVSDTIIGNEHLSLPDKLTAIEKHILEETLKKNNFHQTRAARELGISEARLRYKIRNLNIAK